MSQHLHYRPSSSTGETPVPRVCPIVESIAGHIRRMRNCSRRISTRVCARRWCIFSWLLTRNYAEPSALKVVGDHFLLDARQRTAVMRFACSDQAMESRRSREVAVDSVGDQHLLLDGYNILTTAALPPLSR